MCRGRNSRFVYDADVGIALYSTWPQKYIMQYLRADLILRFPVYFIHQYIFEIQQFGRHSLDKVLK